MKQTQPEAFIETSRTIHNNKYDYSKVEYKGAHGKVCIICPDHGEFWQNANSHKRGCGCPKCKGATLANQHKHSAQTFIEKARTVHGEKYDYSKTEYVRNHDKVTIVCPEHGEFAQTPANHKAGKGCPKCKGEKIRESKTLTIEAFIEKANDAHGDVYDYSGVEYKSSHDKIKIICTKHGAFEQTPNAHLSGQGCPYCGHEERKKNLTQTTEHFLRLARGTHGDRYDYTKTNYVGNHTKVIITCTNHGDFSQTPWDHIMGCGCRKCSATTSIMEKEVAAFLKTMGVNTIMNDRKNIKPFELDIVCPEQKIAIETNGIWWHSTRYIESTHYHINKTEQCENNGIRLIHIYEDEWEKNRGVVENTLRHIFHKDIGDTYNARQCTSKIVETEQARRFLNKNHIQGYAGSSIKMGLFFENDLVAYMGFRKIGEGWLLNRFATKGNVRGGFSKLLNHFKKNYEWSNIISYADRRWSQGNVYKTCGFGLTRVSPPSFDYVKNGIRFNRQQFMKYKLKDKLPFFDPSLTEKENMERNGFYQIWNCGYLKFEMKNA